MFSFGKSLKLQIFGQSHSEWMGMVLDGFPAGIRPDESRLAAFMARRAPGQSELSTPRTESDNVTFVSGILDGYTTGAPICGMIRNENAQSADYEKLKNIPRPSHADFTAIKRFGEYRDHRGGGEFSGRLTAPLCAAGFLCAEYLAEKGVVTGAHIASVGAVRDDVFDPVALDAETLASPGKKDFPVLNDDIGEMMREEILAAKEAGDSVGGTVEGAILGVPAGMGGTFFDGIESRLAQALFAIPAVKGVEFGSGFAGSALRGSENNDGFRVLDGEVRPETNRAGGILGGIASGMPILFRVAVKPTPSVGVRQHTVLMSENRNVNVAISGRHDPCIVPRVVPAVEAAAAIVMADLLLSETGEFAK